MKILYTLEKTKEGTKCCFVVHRKKEYKSFTVILKKGEHLEEKNCMNNIIGMINEYINENTDGNIKEFSSKL